jgi:hypothetical protein
MRRIDRDTHARRHTGDCAADACHRARRFVARNERLADRERADPAVLEVVQVRAADAGRAEPDLDLVGRQLGACCLFEPQVVRGMDPANQ